MTGGGTGGHIIPNIAVIEELRDKPKMEILCIGSHEGPEKMMMKNLGVKYLSISCGKFRRYFSLLNVADFFKIFAGIFQALKILKSFSPDVVFSKGGYISFPVVLAAKILRIPIVAHESDLSPGLSNKLAFRFAKTICVSFEETKKYIKKSLREKIVVTGNPIRKSILNGDKDRGYKFTGFNKFRPVILVMGGSQGARQINNLVRQNLDEILKKFQIVHLCGKGNLDIGIHKNGYAQYEYLNEQLKDIYAISEIVISRGGANSLFELAILKKKVLIIPLSFEGSRGEQITNAKFFSNKFGWSVISGGISKKEFIENIEFAFKNEMNKTGSIKNGTQEIVKIITNIAKWKLII